MTGQLIPFVIEKTEHGERSYDIYSRLLKDRIIFIGSPITDNLANAIIAQFLFLQNEDSEKNRRARANALMDAQCLYYLKLFNKDKALYVEDLNECLEQTKDWLKISMLIRADYLEALDSTVRITPEGLTAWEQLNKFTHIRDTQQTSE